MITPQNTFHYACSHEVATLYVKRSRRPRCSFLFGGQGSRSAAVLLLLIMFSTLGCDVIGVFKDNSTRPVDHELVLRFVEQHEIAPEAPDVPKLFFTMRTKKNFGCSGYRIRHEVERTNDQVVVQILGIKGPEGNCSAVVAPASARFKLPLDLGTYTLMLVNGEIRDEYTVTVTNQRVEVKTVDAGWTEPTATLHWRYPSDSFAYYCGTTQETTALCADFEGRLQDLPITRIEVPEEGEWPYRLQSKGYKFDAPALFYRYPDEATWEEIKARLRTFTQERIRNRDGIGLEVENWLFDGVRSWMVDQ